MVEVKTWAAPAFRQVRERVRVNGLQKWSGWGGSYYNVCARPCQFLVSNFITPASTGEVSPRP